MTNTQFDLNINTFETPEADFAEMFAPDEDSAAQQPAQAPAAADRGSSFMQPAPAPQTAAQAPAAEPGTFAAAPVPAPRYYGYVPFPERIAEAAAQPDDDMGLGIRLAIHYKGMIAFTPDDKGGQWFTNFTGKVWEHDLKGVRTMQAMRTVIMSIRHEEAEMCAESDPDVIAAQERLDKLETIGSDPKTIGAAAGTVARMRDKAKQDRLDFAKRSGTSSTHISAGLDGAKMLLGVDRRLFDKDKHLINCQNGTLDTRTLELRPHDPADMMTKITACNYVEGATHEDVETVLAAVESHGKGIREMLRRTLGMALTGYNSAKSFLYVTGPSDSGKSTAITAACHTLGDVDGNGYARMVNPNTFAASNAASSAASPDLHNVMGARLVFTDEAWKGTMNAQTLNTAAAGGTLITRPLHGAPVSWKSEMTIIFAGNHHMAIPGNDPGLTRRLIAVEMQRPLSEDELDVNLQFRMAEPAQQEAMLYFMATGARDWQADNADRAALNIPEIVKASTAAYLGGEDELAEFFEACVTVADHTEVSARLEVHSVAEWHCIYTEFAHRHGILPQQHVKLSDFRKRLAEKGYTDTMTRTLKRGTMRIVRGIEPRNDKMSHDF